MRKFKTIRIVIIHFNIDNYMTPMMINKAKWFYHRWFYIEIFNFDHNFHNPCAASESTCIKRQL